MNSNVTYVHLTRTDVPGEVTTVEIYDDGFVRFPPEDRVEYSIRDLKDVLAEAEYQLDNATEDQLDYEDEYDEDYQVSDYDNDEDY